MTGVQTCALPIYVLNENRPPGAPKGYPHLLPVFHSSLLCGLPFTIRTDHAALKWLMSFKEPEGQVARWIEQLQAFQFTIQHRAGESHTNADSLSRRPCAPDCHHCNREEEREAANLQTGEVICRGKQKYRGRVEIGRASCRERVSSPV